LLIDPLDPEMLVLRASSGIYAAPEIDNYRQSIQQGIVGAAAQNRQRLLILDVQSDPRYIRIPRSSQIYAELAVPIIVGNRLVGVLNIESEQVITEEDAAGFEIIADQLGVAIDNARLFAEIQGALDQAQLLYETIGRISTAMDVDEVVQAYLEQVAARGRYACNVVLYEFDEEGQRTAVIVHGRWTPQDGFVRVEERLPYTQDSLDPLLDAGQTITFADIQTDLRAPTGLRHMQLQDRRPALALIPLMVRGQRIGLVVLSYASVHEWRDIDLQPYQATAAQLSTAIDSRRQQQLLFERGQEIAVLQERQRLARDLHDSVTQLIFSITLIAQSIAPAWRRDTAEGERRVQRLLELSQSALVEMRALLAELRPPESASTLSKGESEAAVQSTLSPIPINVSATSPLPGIMQVQRDGLVVALRRYLADVARDGLQIDLETSGYMRQSLQQEEAFYRIIQEALNNVVKHAQARRVKINLCVDDHLTHVTVTDDGRGFVQEPTPALAAASAKGGKKAGGLGLMTMRERAEALGGMIQLRSAVDHGTTVAVTIPRKDE
jgi:signal transduction histidine kinase